MALYSTGTVAVTNGSTTVTGTGTAWNSVLQAGWVFIGPDGLPVGIADVVSNTELTLTRPYGGATAGTQTYECFATQQLAIPVVQGVQQLVSDFQGVVDGPGAGRFPDGTLSAPGVRFEADPDTGLRRIGSNGLSVVAGGNDALIVAPDGITGTGVQANRAETGNKLLKAGAGGLLLNDEDAPAVALAAGSDDLNALRQSGFWLYQSSTANAPTSTGVVHHICRLGGFTSFGRHIQIAYAQDGAIYRRINDGVGGWSAWASVVMSDAVDGVPGLTFNGNPIGGELITIADDAVGVFTPPRTGGFANITCDGNTGAPQIQLSANVYFDVGASSLAIEKSGGWTSLGSNVDVSNTLTPTGATGTDGRVLVAVTADALRIENRSGQARSFAVTFT